MDITVQLTFIWRNLIANGFPLEYEQTEMLKNLRMKEMLNWIHLHYAEKILLEDIARARQLSRSECCRYFQTNSKKDTSELCNGLSNLTKLNFASTTLM
jgi:AraC-like DNA-binding protein